MSDTATAVGIDLGTTYSVVARLDRDGKPVTLINEEGDLTTPSVVLFDDAGPVVGREAVKAIEFEPDRIAMFAKRDMGDEVYHQRILGRQVPPEVVQALILKKIRRDAALKVGDFTKAVITVPAYFNEPRRKATQDAGRLAGLDVLDIINEPTAAAIAYGVQEGFVGEDGRAKETETVLVYDLGGGTFDVTVMRIDGSHYDTVATAGDVHLGGVDWDEQIASYVIEAFADKHGVRLNEHPDIRNKLLQECAEVKRALTARDEVTMHFAFEGKRISVPLTRDKFEELTVGLLDRTRMTVTRVLKDAGLAWSDLSRLLLVGGSTRMPMVHRMLEAESGLEVDRSLSPDEAVAHGAAMYAGMLLSNTVGTKDGISVQNVNSHDLGVLGVERATKRPRRKVMIPRNSGLPTSVERQFRTHETGQPNVVVKVVEGGTDSGAHSTPIGRCVVTDIPPDLPAGTKVLVHFEYETDGRLHVTAAIPEAGVDARMVIERASGLTLDEIEDWAAKIEAGLTPDDIATVCDDEASADIADDEAPQEEPADASDPVADTQDNSDDAVAFSASEDGPAEVIVVDSDDATNEDDPFAELAEVDILDFSEDEDGDMSLEEVDDLEEFEVDESAGAPPAPAAPAPTAQALPTPTPPAQTPPKAAPVAKPAALPTPTGDAANPPANPIGPPPNLPQEESEPEKVDTGDDALNDFFKGLGD